MTMTVKRAAAIAAIAGALLAALYCFMTYVPPEARRDAAETDKILSGMDATLDGHEKDVREHEKETKGKIVYIRESVRAEVAALDADGLARAALAEIELFRRSAGGEADTRPSGLGGRGGGLLSE